MLSASYFFLKGSHYLSCYQHTWITVEPQGNPGVSLVLRHGGKHAETSNSKDISVEAGSNYSRKLFEGFFPTQKISLLVLNSYLLIDGLHVAQNSTITT